jgi:hypothetical protein
MGDRGVIDGEGCVSKLLEASESLRGRWEAHLSRWRNAERNLCHDLEEVAEHAIDELVRCKGGEIQRLLGAVEELMVDGTDEVREAVATCFLENLQNAASAGRFPARRFVEFLGPRSAEHCRAWDRFTGVRTEGLWVSGDTH